MRIKVAHMSNQTPSEVASILGKRALGVPKRLTDEERERRRQAMRKLNAARQIRLAKAKADKEQLQAAVQGRSAAGLFTPIQTGE